MSAEGTWNVSMQTPIGERKLTMALKAVDHELTGHATGEGTSAEIFDAKESGGSLSLKAVITTPMRLTLEVVGVIAGDKITGTVSSWGVGSWPFTASRA